MNEQRLQEYLNLIQALLECPNGEEIINTLNAHPHLIDPDLVEVMQQKAAMMAQQGNENNARFLTDLAQEIAAYLHNHLSPESRQEYINFLVEVLVATADSKGNPQVVYPILKANQDKLNHRLVALYPNWANHILSQATPEQAPSYAAAFVYFSNLIQQFPLGNRASNLDIAITGYELILNIFTRENFPENWAMTQNNLGNAYSDKITGNRAENIDEAICCYQRALKVYTREDFPQDWAGTQNNLGEAYRTKITGNRADNIDEAICCYQQALEVRTREDFPQDWAGTQNGLGNAYSNKITGNRAQNIDEAIRCYQRALEVRTREDFPEDWAGTQNNLAIAYKNKITGNRAENIDAAIACYQRALEVRTREDFPEDWAMTQNNLGGAYSNKITGNRAENIDAAIACYQRALEVRTREDFPEDWAGTQNGLGIAYKNKITGNRAENIDAAIACYLRALEVYTREDFPEDWAMTQNNLGGAYSNKITGNRAENIDAAIACFQRALEVRTREDFPEDWAMTQNNLGEAYRNKITGNRAENIDAAIACFQRALEVRTREDFPKNWAMTQNNLGNAHWSKITGNRAENIDEAIRCFQRALKVRTREDFPQDWAGTQIGLGSAYSNKITGNRAENIDEAIRCYQLALEVYTREDFPEYWAMTQNNLGITYSNKITGNRAENIDSAIACYQRALEVYTREDFPEYWAGTQNGLGNAYSDKITGNRAQNIDEAIACYQRALEVYSREDFPEYWAMTQNNLGNAYKNKITGNRAENIDEAIRCYQRALEIRTPEAFPKDCLQSGRNLGNLGFKEGKWEIAIEGYESAIKAVEKSRSWSKTDASRQQIIADSIDVYANIIQAYINSGNLDKAIAYVDRSRAKRLVDLMASNDLYADGEIPPQVQAYLQQYDQLQAEIDAERNRLQNNSDSSQQQTENSTNQGTDKPTNKGTVTSTRAAFQAATEKIAALEAEKQQVWEQMRRLDPVLAGEKEVNPLDFATIQQLIENPQTAILNFFTTNNDTHIFIIYKDKNPELHTCTGFGYQTLQDLVVNEWLNPYFNKKQDGLWYAKISDFLQQLADKLQLKNLVETYLQDIKELIIIPHLFWHQIPFAALPFLTDETQYLGDKFPIRYVPSSQILQYCQQRPQLDKINYGTVENPDGSLPSVEFECETIANLHQIPAHQRLKGREQATVKNYRQLAKQVQVLHSSHHAQSRLDNPLESILILADGQITLGQIMTPGFRLPNLSDVFLSCCETNLGVAGISDDILSLSTGFLCAGARNVVSTLWSVDDLATALFSIFYYQNRQRLNRPEALKKAQIDLRNLSGQTLASNYKAELQKYYDRQLQLADQKRQKAKKNRQRLVAGTPDYQRWDEEYKQWDAIGNRIFRVQQNLPILCGKEYPFADPFYWAGFICSGLR
ncbi:CHAT domain-containing tetratricopeptide repeat protein [Planktothricoides raciborskii]|uniref:CHAT domain-containing tetratricopeptide repeat protein n=1 Tax=Planktothricoides raciborskii GIHE-MW2 TaxID=2792601 RepID=A0AAU8J748_9CYAN